MEENRKKKDFVERVNEEYDAFRLEMLSGSKEVIYDEAFKIYFYQAVADYLTDDYNVNCLDEEMLENESPISSYNKSCGDQPPDSQSGLTDPLFKLYNRMALV